MPPSLIPYRLKTARSGGGRQRRKRLTRSPPTIVRSGKYAAGSWAGTAPEVPRRDRQDLDALLLGRRAGRRGSRTTASPATTSRPPVIGPPPLHIARSKLSSCYQLQVEPAAIPVTAHASRTSRSSGPARATTVRGRPSSRRSSPRTAGRDRRVRPAAVAGRRGVLGGVVPSGEGAGGPVVTSLRPSTTTSAPAPFDADCHGPRRIGEADGKPGARRGHRRGRRERQSRGEDAQHPVGRLGTGGPGGRRARSGGGVPSCA